MPPWVAVPDTGVPFPSQSLFPRAGCWVHHVSRFQLISPWAAPGLPKRLHVMRVNDLVLSAYDSNTGRLAPCNGYNLGDQFWSESKAWYQAWDSWVETEYQSLVRKMNTSSPRAVLLHADPEDL
ncbi:unnamed protein product [Lepidochelys olivacea]